MSEQEPIPLERPEPDAAKRLHLREAWRHLCDLTAEVMPMYEANFLAGGRSGVIVVVGVGERERELRELVARWEGEVQPDPEDPALRERDDERGRVEAGSNRGGAPS